MAITRSTDLRRRERRFESCRGHHPLTSGYAVHKSQRASGAWDERSYSHFMPPRIRRSAATSSSCPAGRTGPSSTAAPTRSPASRARSARSRRPTRPLRRRSPASSARSTRTSSPSRSSRSSRPSSSGRRSPSSRRRPASGTTDLIRFYALPVLSHLQAATLDAVAPRRVQQPRGLRAGPSAPSAAVRGRRTPRGGERRPPASPR